MRWLLFLSRLAFICGICFLASLALLLKKGGNNEVISQTVIIIGYIMGLVVVPFTLLCYLGVLMARKKIPVPVWLIVCNVLFMFVLLFYILFINVKGNYPS